jgi:hypothetical protein
LGSAETYICEQALLGTISVPTSSAALSDADPADKKLIMGRNANSTAMVLLRISLTDGIRVDQIYTSRRPKLTWVCGKKDWLNLNKMFYPISTENMKNELSMCNLNRHDTNRASWFAQIR